MVLWKQNSVESIHDSFIHLWVKIIKLCSLMAQKKTLIVIQGCTCKRQLLVLALHITLGNVYIPTVDSFHLLNLAPLINHFNVCNGCVNQVSQYPYPWCLEF